MIMGLLDDYSGPGGLLGIGMTPRPALLHQLKAGDIYSGLKNILNKNKYFVAYESCVDLNDLNSQVPDIIVYEKQTLKPVMFIEVTKTSEKRTIEKKAEALMKRYDIYEGFIYDYEKSTFNKLTGFEKYSTAKSYSDIFKLDLSRFV